MWVLLSVGFTIDRAAPQEHDTVGSVERGVREVKEAMSVIILEVEKAGLSIRRTAVASEALARYVTAMHNLHGKVATSGKTAKEVLRDQEGTSQRVSAMFCSKVLAKTPKSVPSVGRFRTAAYLYPVRNSFSHFVVAKIEGELIYFHAKSLKYIFSLEYPLELVERFLDQIGGPSQPPTGPDGGSTDVRIVPDNYAKLPDAVPPPRVWLDSHGDTPDCAGCASKKGRHTNKLPIMDAGPSPTEVGWRCGSRR